MRGDREVAISVLFCLALPVVLLRLFNANDASSLTTLGGGVAIYILLPFVVERVCEDSVPKHVTRLVQFLSIFIFACSTDLMMALQNDGLLNDLATFYYKNAESYLASPYSSVILYFDGTVHFGLYMTLIYRVTRDLEYKPAACFLVGSMVNSLVILLVGSCIGSYDVKLPILLNLPYLILPLLLLRWMQSSDNTKSDSEVSLGPCHKLVYGLFFSAAAVAAVVRGLAALGATGDFFKWYLNSVEPYLGHHTGYPKAQALMYVFYFLPYYCHVIVQFAEGTSPSFLAAMVHAGAALQAQVGHLGVFFRSDFKTAGNLPVAFSTESHIHTAISVSLLIVPLLFAYHCYCNRKTKYTSLYSRCSINKRY